MATNVPLPDALKVVYRSGDSVLCEAPDGRQAHFYGELEVLP